MLMLVIYVFNLYDFIRCCFIELETHTSAPANDDQTLTPTFTPTLITTENVTPNLNPNPTLPSSI
ncbi:hypothetical protein EON65_54240, partial [archaeon]